MLIVSDKRIFRVAGPDIVFEEFDGELVVLNLASGRYFGFNAPAAAVWRGGDSAENRGSASGGSARSHGGVRHVLCPLRP